MSTWRPDQSFYSLLRMTRAAPSERLGYVAMLTPLVWAAALVLTGLVTLWR